MAFVIDQAARELCEDVVIALERAGIKKSAAAALMHVPLPKFSEQINGKVPFTSAWRLTRLDADFWRELVAIRAQRLGGEFLVSADLLRLVHGVEQLVAARKPMARAQMKEKVSA